MENFQKEKVTPAPKPGLFRRLAALAVAAALLTAGVSPAAADGSGPYSGKVLTFRDSSDTNTALGMWVWDIRVIVGDDPRVDMDAQLLLDMLAKNHFTEIYLGCAYLMDDEQVAANGGVVAPGYVGEDQLRSFIASCSAIGVRVSLLTATSGDAAYDWWDASLGYAETAALINDTKQRGGRVIAVGTTSCRTLESVGMTDGRIQPAEGWTDIFIYPGYRFQVLDGLLTNFHLPESTLIMLVSALIGREPATKTR